MKLALHILWIVVSIAGVIILPLLLQAVYDHDHSQQDIIVLLILIALFIASAVASGVLYVR